MKTALGLALSIACAACGAEPATPPAEAPPAAPVHDARLAGDQALRAWLELQPVTLTDFGRRVLYTWTTDAGAAELARTRTLLVAHPDKHTLYDADIAPQSLGRNLAYVLGAEAFSRRRYAWANPWATARGFGDEQYGDRLVRIVLKEDAALVAIGRGLRFMNAKGEIISWNDAVQPPNHLAAVFDEHATSAVPTPFREYVVVNESMIEEWSIGTDAIRARLALDAEMLRRYAAALQARGLVRPRADLGGRVRDVVDYAWLGGAAHPTDDQLYLTALAFPTLVYDADAVAVRAIAARLEGLPPQGNAVVVRPAADFVAPPPEPPEPPRAPAPSERPCVPSGSLCIPVRR